MYHYKDKKPKYAIIKIPNSECFERDMAGSPNTQF